MNDRSICVVLHDVAPPTWDACRRVLDGLAAEVGAFPVTLLAVPRFHDAPRHRGFERWLCQRAAAGDEVALHGWRHLDDGAPRNPIDRLRRHFYTRREGEFADLPFLEAMRRIDAGLAWLDGLGIRPAGFVPPAWLLGGESWRAVKAHDFDYTCTLRQIHLMQGARAVTCQSQVYSSASSWRRGISRAWNRTLAHAQRHDPLVRLELHPGDAEHAAIRASWQALASAQLRTRRAVTLETAARELQGGVRTAPVPMSP